MTLLARSTGGALFYLCDVGFDLFFDLLLFFFWGRVLLFTPWQQFLYYEL
eukprot:gene5939-4248_t